MNKLITRSGLLALALGVCVAGAWQAQPEKKEQPAEKPKDATPAKEQPKAPEAKPETKAGDNYVLGYKMKAIDGKEVDLSTFKGKVVMMVNVASQCGLTPQYEALQKLYEQKKDKGLVILGFPANNFGGQEPGSNEEIAKFCSSKFKVSFPMFAKISVKGDDCHELYKKLAAKAGGPPSWNFTKYLVDREGNVVQRFDSRVKPDDAELIKKLDELLAKPDPAKKATGN